MLGVASGGATGSPSAVAPDPYDEERDAWVVLSSVVGLGPVALSALLERYDNGRAVLAEASAPGGVTRLAATPVVERRGTERTRRPVPDGVARAIGEAAAAGPSILADVRRLGIRAVTIEEPTYPARLAKIAMPPHVLFVSGDASALGRAHAVAVVGTRRATTGGRTTAGRIATALVAAGASVVSGLAYGIDGAAHEATIRAGGTTVAVIGGGHAVLSPAGHARLAEATIAAGGAVVSEHAPRIQPTHGTFPRRNRLISGLSDATVVVEAPARSGALITASWALEQGRECYVVPGGLDAPASAGCLAFLREFEREVHIVAGIPQLIADLGLAGSQAGPGAGAPPIVQATLQDLGQTESLVARELVRGRVTVDEVVAAADLPVATVLAALTMLERRGLAVGIHGRYRPAGSLLVAEPHASSAGRAVARPGTAVLP